MARTGDVMGTFGERIRKLEADVGDGEITAGIVVHQPYAADVHVDRQDKHPRGGRSHYVEDPFFHDLTDNLRKIAREVVTQEGSNLENAMQDIAESFDRSLKANAPWETNTLRESGNVYVKQKGVITWQKHQRTRYKSEKE